MSAVTKNEFTGDGSATTYSFTFPYLKTSDIKASLDGVETSAFTLPTATTLQFNTAPSTGAKIKIFRKTGIDTLTATFYAGSAIKSEDLNDNFTQNLYSTQEFSDRGVTEEGGTIVGNLTISSGGRIKFQHTDAANASLYGTLVGPSGSLAQTYTLPSRGGTFITTNADSSVNSTECINGDMIKDDVINSQHYVDGSIDTAHIGDLQVATAKIADNAVTADKLAHTSVTAGTYSFADITVDAQGRITAAASTALLPATRLAIDAVTTEKIEDDAVTGAKIGHGSVSSINMGVNSVGTNALSNLSVTYDKLASGAVKGNRIDDLGISFEKLQDSAVRNAKIQNGAVNEDKLATNAVITDKILDDAVTGAKIADGEITNDHINSNASIAQSKLNITTIPMTAASVNNVHHSVVITNGATGNEAPKSSSGLTFRPSGNILTCAGPVSATNFSTSSDITLKENIQPLTNSLNKLNQLTGYKFDYKNSDITSMGVMAQDVEKVFPELVEGQEGEKTLQYNGLIGALIESVKELSAKVTALESK